MARNTGKLVRCLQRSDQEKSHLRLGKKKATFAANCTHEAKYGLLNITGQPQSPTRDPIPIIIHPPPPGVLCYAQPHTPWHTWDAGYSTCAYTDWDTEYHHPHHKQNGAERRRSTPWLLLAYGTVSEHGAKRDGPECWVVVDLWKKCLQVVAKWMDGILFLRIPATPLLSHERTATRQTAEPLSCNGNSTTCHLRGSPFRDDSLSQVWHQPASSPVQQTVSIHYHLLKRDTPNREGHQPRAVPTQTNCVVNETGSGFCPCLVRGYMCPD